MEGKQMPKITNQRQFEAMVDYMEENQGLACGYVVSQDARSNSKLLWETLSNNLNSLGPPLRETAEWKRVWADLKQNIKKKLRQNVKALNKTGDFNKTIYLTPMEQKVDELCALTDAVNGVAGVRTFGVPNIANNNVSNTEEGATDDVAMPSEDSPLPRPITPFADNIAENSCVEEACVAPLPLRLRRSGLRKRTSKQLRESLMSKQVKTQSETYKQFLIDMQHQLKLLKKLLAAQNKTNQLQEKMLVLKQEKLELLKLERLDKMKNHADKMQLKLQLLEIKQTRLGPE